MDNNRDKKEISFQEFVQELRENDKLVSITYQSAKNTMWDWVMAGFGLSLGFVWLLSIIWGGVKLLFGL